MRLVQYAIAMYIVNMSASCWDTKMVGQFLMTTIKLLRDGFGWGIWFLWTSYLFGYMVPKKIKMWNVDGRRTKSDGNSSHGLKTRWANKPMRGVMSEFVVQKPISDDPTKSWDIEKYQSLFKRAKSLRNVNWILPVMIRYTYLCWKKNTDNAW